MSRKRGRRKPRILQGLVYLRQKKPGRTGWSTVGNATWGLRKLWTENMFGFGHEAILHEGKLFLFVKRLPVTLC